MFSTHYVNSPKQVKTCNRCKGRLIEDYDHNEIVCSRCGHVKNHNDDYLELVSGQQTQTSHTRNEGSLTTVMDVKNIDAYGNKISKFTETNKLRKLNKIAISDPKTRNVSKAWREIERISVALGLGDSIIQRAEYMYKKIMQKDFVKGRSISGMSGIAVYLACMEYEVPCSILEIKKHLTDIKKKTLLRYYKEISECMEVENTTIPRYKIITKIAKKANLSVKAERKAMQIFDTIKDEPILAGKRPNSIVSAALYLASKIIDEKTTQLRLANAADITPMTIRKRFVEISEVYKKKIDANTHAEQFSEHLQKYDINE